ncbi:MAG: Asp/Glu racemase [Oceanospirillaceae bacterium]|jgi:maleate isomerase|nr:Asp/Glu racemase [Oceanospirillaceae bacterium]MBT6076524.1 Asp/Glu racemase [Oceanospirillaceae bacterium]
MRAQSFELAGQSIINARRLRIGMIVPSSNTNAEPDCQMLAPPGVTLHVTRSGGYDVNAIPDSNQMRLFVRQSLDQQLALLVDARVDLIAYACTSATLSDGPQFDAEFCQEIEDKSGCKAVTTAGAVVEAIQALGAERIAFTSPYVTKLAEESVNYVNQCGIEVVNRLDFDRKLSSLEQNALTPQDAYKMGLAVDHPNAQAVFISCTDYRALEALPALEQALGKPVICSNQALMYACLKRLSLDCDNPLGGRLFSGRF